jgi:hypothetical protein
MFNQELNLDVISSTNEGLLKVALCERMEEDIKKCKTKKYQIRNLMRELADKVASGEILKEGIHYKKAVTRLRIVEDANDNRLANLEKALKQTLSYVEVMPNYKKVEDKRILSEPERYSLNTAGYTRDEFQPSEINRNSPPPAKPELDAVNLDLYTPGDPMQGVYKDRLKSSQRFEDYIRRRALDSQEVLNQHLGAAKAKAGAQVVADLADDRAELQDNLMGQIEDLKKVNRSTWAEAAMKGYANYLNESTRSR